MSSRVRFIAGTCLVAIALAASARAQMPDAKTKVSGYEQINLVTSTESLKAKVHDPNLLNPWGLVQGPTPFWISDNNAGVSTLYDGNGKIFTIKLTKKSKPVQFVVGVPPPNGSKAVAAPTGIVFNNNSKEFTGDLFIFSTEDGTISGWQTPADGAVAKLQVDNSKVPSAMDGAVYKGLEIATVGGKQFLYATNFRSGDIDVFDDTYKATTAPLTAGDLIDPQPLGPGYAPFGIRLFGTDKLWVTYALQDVAKHDPVHQAGAGYINIFSTDGQFIVTFAKGGKLNAPWGMAFAPASFGPMGGDFWIGNFGDGMINVYNSMGTSVDQPKDMNGNPLKVDGLWALVFGNNSANASPNSLYFTAGPNMETQGIFGKFDFVSKKKSTGMPGPMPNPY